MYLRLQEGIISISFQAVMKRRLCCPKNSYIPFFVIFLLRWRRNTQHRTKQRIVVTTDTYTKTLRRFRLTNVAAEKQNVSYIMSVCPYSCLRYPACKSNVFCAVCIVTSGLSGSATFIDIISQTARFSGEKI